MKSGPALTGSVTPGSSLVAVMRRDAAKAEDYARRHGVPAWYSDANELLADNNVNAVRTLRTLCVGGGVGVWG